MRKTLLLPLVALAAIAIAAPPASATYLAVGYHAAGTEMKDWGSFWEYSDTVGDYVPIDTVYWNSATDNRVPQEDWEDRTIIRMDVLQVWDEVSSSWVTYYNTTSPVTIVGLAYDLLITSVSTTDNKLWTVEVGDGPRFDDQDTDWSAWSGGKVDFWVIPGQPQSFLPAKPSAANWTEAGDPTTYAGGDPFASTNWYDQFTGITDVVGATPIMSGTFVPPSGMDTTQLLLYDLYLQAVGTNPAGSGKASYGYIHLIWNTDLPFADLFGPSADAGLLGAVPGAAASAAEIRYRADFTFYPLTGSGWETTHHVDTDPKDGDTWWNVWTEDNPEFHTLPEPGTMSLLGLGLAGLVGLVRRRRK